MANAQTITQLVTPFIEYCAVEKGLSPLTQRNYTQYLKLFCGWLGGTGNRDLRPENLNDDHIWDFRLYLARTYRSPLNKPISTRTQNLYLMALRAFLTFFIERHITSIAPSRVKPAKNTDAGKITHLSDDEINAIINVPDITTPIGLRDRAIIELLFSSGMRLAEITTLNAEQFDFLTSANAGQTHELSITGKGNRVRPIFISPRAATWLRRYLQSRKDMHAPLFVNPSASAAAVPRLSPRTIQRMISRSAQTSAYRSTHPKG